jgi:hypothetical protein
MYATRQGKPQGSGKRRKDRVHGSEGTGEGSSSAYARMKRQSEQQAQQLPTDDAGARDGRGK